MMSNPHPAAAKVETENEPQDPEAKAQEDTTDDAVNLVYCKEPVTAPEELEDVAKNFLKTDEVVYVHSSNPDEGALAMPKESLQYMLRNPPPHMELKYVNGKWTSFWK